MYYTDCPDSNLTNLTTKSEMVSNGWKINVEYSSSADQFDDYTHICGNETFYGYNTDNTVGEVSTTFKGYGKATLSFGNCHKKGHVVVTLNNRELARVHASNPNNVIAFYYKTGDVLHIKEVLTAIIKLNYLKLECGGMLFRCKWQLQFIGIHYVCVCVLANC